MMRIAIAGGSGLGYLLASQLARAANAYQVVVLSRSVCQPTSYLMFLTTKARPDYAALDVQVMVVNYNDENSLSYALHGVNLVICTFSGVEQINLITAAVQSGVQYFVPSEFEGSLEKRPENDQLDPYLYSSQARQHLRRFARSSQMKWTVFSCGIFMERFLPQGLGSLAIGYGSNLANAGSYLLDMSAYTAEYVEKNARGHTVRVCMTSVYDVAQFIVAAIDLGPANWPREFTMRGDRLSLRDTVGQCSRTLNAAFSLSQWQAADISRLMSGFYQQGDYARVAFYQQLQATVEGRYDFGHASLNDLVNVQPRNFRQWLSDQFTE
ncbi:isoflavone reductase family [Fusarium beomiforme]|uniref:Isoflavone reductase family n=1 Tax=Fusarium beomiforme TaxID=44412 RepID=A0A9P5AVJ0_9HYPO|nr:isoflavone reductase family [Fusarium beomiforme]